MKKLLGVLLVIIMALFGFSACTNGNPNGNESGNNGETGGNGNIGDSGNIGGNGDTENENGTTNPPVTTSDILIAYFSCTNTTEAIAKHIEAETKGTLYEIIPEVPYTADDLKYYTNGRADKEQANSTVRPAINGSVENMGKYDVVFLGYPIWHGQAPRIISTFLESYDFSGKKIIPFCTSHSSGIGSSDTNLHSLASTAEWVSGRRFPSGTSQKTVADWIDSLELKVFSTVANFDLASGINGKAPTVKLNSGYQMPILGLGTYSLTGDTCKNAVKSALSQGYRLIDTAHMYGNEREKSTIGIEVKDV